MNRKLLIIGSVVGLLLIIVIGLSIRQASIFGLSKTDPGNGGTPNQYTAVVFSFNQPLADTKPGVNEITITPDIAGKTVLSDKTVTFIPDSSYNVDAAYQATLKGILSKQGEKLKDVSISFSPKFVAYNDLPNDVKQRLNVDTTDKPGPYVPNAISIGGTATLMDRGLSEDQLYGFKTALYNYFVSQKKTVRALDLININKAPHKFGTFNDTFVFDISINGSTTYHGELDYSDTSTTRLVLTDPKTKKLLFDSQTAPTPASE